MYRYESLIKHIMWLKSYEHLTMTCQTYSRRSLVTVLHYQCLDIVKMYKYAKFDQNIICSIICHFPVVQEL